ASLSDGKLYARDKPAALAAQTRLSGITVELGAVYAQWEKLEAQAGR
ncbi:MAG: hypothetical protein JWR16_823, partial [Nevskia sp.]|nr:hypothetical protein [Nevskia sp.]